MNKTAIKNFAIFARVELIEIAKQRAYEYEVTDGGENKPGLEVIGGRPLSKTEKEQRDQLIVEINSKGFSQVMEEVAYTWFNRFIALRFMEVNGYLPSKVRVFTDENGEFKPEILKQAMFVDFEGFDRNKVLDLIDKQDNEGLYKYLLITQCNALNAGLPYMFEKIANWTELLFPTNLLRQDSVIGQMVSEIPEEDWADAVQIIGWLYQYYNTELFDEIYDGDMSKRQIKSEQIPAATQLFTPDWVVRYMVENSLGRLWYEGHSDFDKSQWKYYLDDEKQEPEVEEQLRKIRDGFSVVKPEGIKVIDPCMGSGHILVYAFDVLMQIYTCAGWAERDAARSIIENNLYGLDIDDRAGQLAYFAVMMKARKHNRRILNGETEPNISAIQDSNWMTDEFILYIAGKDEAIKADLILLRKTFENAKEFGSILKMPTINYNAIIEKVNDLESTYAEDLFQAHHKAIATEKLTPLIKQAQIMAGKYDVVFTNPPYLSNSRFDAHLSQYVNDNYPDEKADLAMIMLKRMLFGFSKKNGYISAITTVSWMFLKSFEKFRQNLIRNRDFVNIVDFGTELFEGKTGHLPVAAWVNRNSGILPVFTAIRLVDFCYARREEKEPEFFNSENRFTMHQTSLEKIPGCPVAYWVSENFANNYTQKTIGDYAEVITGMTIGNNKKYLRLWFEVNIRKIAFGKKSMSEVDLGKTNWIPYSKGGPRRNWYGNYDYVVNWSQKNNFNRSKTTLQHLYLKEAITWPFISLGNFSARLLPTGSLWDVAGSPCFFKDKRTEYYTLAVMASCVANYIINAVNPTVNVQAADIARIPLVFKDNNTTDQIVTLVERCIELSKDDWNSYETSIDFSIHPLLKHKKEGKSSLISNAYVAYESEANRRFTTLKNIEETINSILIDVYSLQQDIEPSVMEKNITINKIDKASAIKSLISYFVGVVFGRYSLDKSGLCYAGGEWDDSMYTTIIPDDDNIIPICDDDYFDDDVVGKFVDFIRKVYGEETLEQNLRFIADALGGKGSSREVIRNYFLNDFFVEHCNIYSVTGSGKRPIYWLFSSGKKNGFKALIYMHRYQPDLLARMRTDYVHEQQERYRTQLQMLEVSAQSAAPSERVKLNKQITKFKDQALEIQKYEEKVHHLADQMIAINLDDGVKVNYDKFKDVLEKIK